MAYDYQIRPALYQAGYKDSDIGWDQGRQTVTLKGQDFLGGDNLTNVSGSTFTDRQSFDNALKKYNQGQQTQQLQSAVTNYQMPANPYTQQLDDQIKYLMSFAQQNQQPVDPYSTAQYAAYKGQSDRRAQEGTRAAQEALGSSGFGRSTTLGERAQGIQNEEEAFLETQVIPQILAAEEAKRQQQFSNMSSMLDPLMNQRNYADNRAQTERGNAYDALGMLLGEDQRGVENARADRNFDRGVLESDRNFNYQQTRDQRNDYESDRLFDYGIYRDNVGDEQWKKQFDQSVKAQAQQMGYNWASLNQRERQMVADQTARQEEKAYSQMQDQFSMGLQTFQQTGQMPDYMSAFGVNVEGLKNQETQAEVLGLMNDLATGAVQPEAALKMIEQAEKSGIKTGVVSTQLKNTVYDMFPEYSPESKAAQQKKTEQKQKLISDSIGIANYVPSFNLANKGYDWLKSQWSNYFGG